LIDCKGGKVLPELKKIESLYNQISKHPLFMGLDEKEFSRLIKICSLKHYKKDNKILYSKTPREGLLLILEGMVEVYVEGENQHQDKGVLEVLQTGHFELVQKVHRENVLYISLRNGAYYPVSYFSAKRYFGCILSKNEN